MKLRALMLPATVGAIGFGAPTLADDEPKRGGTLTYMIPADAPPSFDGHREGTYATVHSAAPFYSVLIRINPENPSSTTDFVCDLCTELPQPTDDGKTYTFRIRDGVKFHDGSPLTADDVAASWNKIIAPPEGVTSARESFYVMVDNVEAPDPSTVVFHLKFATSAFLPALADPFAWIYKKEILDKDPRNSKNLHRPLSAGDDLTDVFAWREERTVSNSLTLQYDKVVFLLEPNAITRDLRRKRVTVVDYPDGRLAIRYRGLDLPYTTFDKLRQVSQATIVENKHLGAVLSHIREQQIERAEARSQSAPRRQGQVGHMFKVD